MTAEHWRQIEEIFDLALEVPAEQRSAWLDKNCPNPAIRKEVDDLISANETTGAMQASLKSALTDLAKSVQARDQLRPGGRLGPYELLDEVGRGGMGIVLRARRDDGVFDREVAIKAVHRTALHPQVLARFRQERKILGRLDHPSIARVLDGGSTDDGVPYLVMDFVQGVRITSHCANQKLTLEERLELFIKVCGAVQYAHQQMVVHRDLKPSNILVDSSGEPHLLDFGIAKLLDPGEEGEPLTSDQIRPLTPQYASPEQVRGEQITAASDIYSLGVLLYELLTGKSPHTITNNSPLTIAYVICETDIKPPSEAVRETSPVNAKDIRGDLDDIAMLALQKEPGRRYGSVAQFADDVRRYLNHLPVNARAQTAHYRARKFVRRHRTALIAAGLVAASLVSGIVVATQQARKTQHRADQLRRLTHSFIFEVHDAVRSLPGATEARRLILAKALEQLEALAKEADDTSSRYELGSAFRKIGDAVGGAAGANLGDRKAALAHYQRAIRLMESVIEEDPSHGGARAELISALGDYAMTLRYAGDVAGGKSAYLRGAAAVEDAMKQAGALPEIYLRGAGMYASYSDMARAGSEVKAAMDASERAAELIRIVSARIPPGPELDTAASAAWSSLAKSRARTGDLKGAVAAARESIRIMERQLARNPHDHRVLHLLMLGYGHEGDILGWPSAPNLGDREGAYSSYRKAVAVAEKLASADAKDSRARMDLAIALGRQGAVTAPDRSQEANETYGRAVALFEQLLDTDPGNINVVANYVHVLTLSAKRHAQSRGLNEALAALRKALAAARPGLRDKPNDPVLGRTFIHAAEELTPLLLQQGQQGEASALAREATTIASAGRQDGFAPRLVRARARRLRALTSSHGEACGWWGSSLEDLTAIQKHPDFNPASEAQRKEAAKALAACK